MMSLETILIWTLAYSLYLNLLFASWIALCSSGLPWNESCLKSALRERKAFAEMTVRGV